jgi:hypothetical protein
VCGVGEGDSGGDGAPTRELRDEMLVRLGQPGPGQAAGDAGLLGPVQPGK